MDNIIEKLGITKAPYYNSHNYGCINDYIDDIDDKLYPRLRETEKQRNEMLEALIDFLVIAELKCKNLGNSFSITYHEQLNIIEKVAGKSWEEIKELFGEISNG